MKKTKLLFVMGFMQVGGIEKSLINLCQALNPDEFDITVLILAQGEGIASELPDYVKTLYVDRFRSKSFQKQYSPFLAKIHKKHEQIVLNSSINRFIRRASYLVLKFETHLYKAYISKIFNNSFFDTVVGYMQGEPSDIAMSCFKTLQKYVFYHHGNVLEFLNDKKYYNNATKVIALSQGVKKDIEEKRGVSSEKVIVLHNIYQPSIIIKQAEKKCEYDSISILKLVSVARLSPEKGILNAIEAAKILAQSSLEFLWFIVGEDHTDYGNLCKERIKEYRLENRVHFTGVKQNPFPYVRAADIFIQPSKCEALPNTIVEALILNKPIVSTMTYGALELIENNRNGVLCGFEPIEIANAILKIAHDDSLIQSLCKGTKSSTIVLINEIEKYKALLNGLI